MKLLQFHEYLELLDGGVKSEQPEEGLSRSAIAAAKKLWPKLKLSKWDANPHIVETVTWCAQSGNRFVHITADWKNCFLILVYENNSDKPESYILFDIGAEYSTPHFVCPAYEISEPATSELITKYIPLLQNLESDSFAIIDTGDGTYMQTIFENGKYEVEHQLVSLASHYVLENKVDADTVVTLFNSHAFGRYEWARDYQWKKLEL